MTWEFDPSTGELYGPRGDLRTTLDGPPYSIPTDAQEWAETQFRSVTMAELTTGVLADYAQLWAGNIEVTNE